MVCSFFGHRLVFECNRVGEKLERVVEEKIKQGYDTFLVGRHGDFDKIVLSVLSQLRKVYDINIKIVYTNLNHLTQKNFYLEFETLIYPIEEVYFKNRISFTNKCMVDDSDLIICYVDKNRTGSGAKRAMNYAMKKQKEVINLF